MVLGHGRSLPNLRARAHGRTAREPPPRLLAPASLRDYPRWTMFEKLRRRFRRARPRFALPTEAELTTSPSGLGYLILDEGTGRAPGSRDTVTVRYAGWLLDGRLFDASYPRSISFSLDRVIPGWTEGLQLLREGGSAKLLIPPELAYGARGAPPAIGPNATLLFQVELLAVH